VPANFIYHMYECQLISYTSQTPGQRSIVNRQRKFSYSHRVAILLSKKTVLPEVAYFPRSTITHNFKTQK